MVCCWHAVSLREFLFCWRAFPLREMLCRWHAVSLREFLCCWRFVLLREFQDCCFSPWHHSLFHFLFHSLSCCHFICCFTCFFLWGMRCNLQTLLMNVSYFEPWIILLLQNKFTSLCNNISNNPLKIKFILKSARVSLMPWRFETERKKSPTHSLSGRLKRGRAPNGEIKWPFTADVCSQLHTPIVKMIMISRVYVVSCKRGSLHL